MRRTLVVFAGFALMILALAGCQADTSALESENANLRAEVDSLKAQMEAMPSEGGGDMAAMESQNAELMAEMESMRAEMASMSSGSMPAMMEGGRLAAVMSRGHVICANNDQLPGFGSLDANGNAVGFDVDLCRAVAAAVLGDANAVEFRPTVAAERGPTMQSGEVDMMSRNTTWTSTRDATWGNFAPTMFYDGQGFMVPKSLGVSTLTELAGAEVCVQQGTTTELNLQDFDSQNNLGLTITVFPDAVQTREAYAAGQCEAMTTDRSGLVATRVGFENPDDHTILPGTISEEPLGPVVPHGDEQWFDVVSSVMGILVYAEAFGITQGSVPTAATGSTAVDRLFGLEGGFGQENLGLSATVAQDVIRAVGNYGEIYDRHLTPLGLERDGSRNALWNAAPCQDCPKGGQIYTAPLR